LNLLVIYTPLFGKTSDHFSLPWSAKAVRIWSLRLLYRGYFRTVALTIFGDTTRHENDPRSLTCLAQWSSNDVAASTSQWRRVLLCTCTYCPRWFRLRSSLLWLWI